MLPRGINQFAALGQDQTIEQFQLAEILLYKCCIIEDVILLKGQWRGETAEDRN